MSRQIPLVFLSRSPAPAIPEEQPEAPAKVKSVAQSAHLYSGDRSEVARLYEAAVTGVHSRFSHLAPEDIASPPHQWFDAALARQIALHLLASHFDVPKRAIAEELNRSRGQLVHNLRTIDDRLQHPDFARTYAAIAEQADRAAGQEGAAHDDD